MMATGGSLISSVLDNIIATGLVTAAVLLFSYIYRTRILAWLARAKAWILNDEIQVHITRIDKFDHEPDTGLGMDIFEKIQEEYPEISNSGISDNKIQIKADGIPAVIDVRIEEEHEFGDAQPDIVGYKLVIETFSDLRFGYRSYSSLEKFETMSEDVSDIVQTECFTGQHPTRSFILTKLKEGIPAGVESIEDEELGISASINDSTLEMTFRTPQNLTKGVRRYFKLRQTE